MNRGAVAARSKAAQPARNRRIENQNDKAPFASFRFRSHCLVSSKNPSANHCCRQQRQVYPAGLRADTSSSRFDHQWRAVNIR
jgi:hypothetical protein